MPDQHLLQGTALHGGPGAVQAGQQACIARAGGEQQLLWHQGALFQLQHRLAAPAAQRRALPVHGKDGAGLALGQGAHQGGHIQYQVCEAIDLAAKPFRAQGCRILSGSDFLHPTAQQATGKKGGDPGLQGGGGPQEKILAEHLAAAQVHLALAAQASAPQGGHCGNGFGAVAQGAGQGVLHSAVDHALGTYGLVTAQGLALEQDSAVAAIAELVERPQAGDAAAYYDDICVYYLPAHGG